MAIEIVDFPINSMVIFHCYVSSPEGMEFEWIFNRFPRDFKVSARYHAENGEVPGAGLLDFFQGFSREKSL